MTSSSPHFWIVAALLGLTVRVAALPFGPDYGYLGDHDDFGRWGIQATAGPPRDTAR